MAEKSNPRNELLTFRVRDYMTAEPQTLRVEQSLLEAVLMLRRASLRHIPIMEDGRLVGVLSDRDVARVAPSLLAPLSPDEYNRVFEDTPVGRVMSKNPISTTADAPLAEAVGLLYENRLGCLPVLEEGKLIGIITRVDMLRALHDLIASPASASSSEL